VLEISGLSAGYLGEDVVHDVSLNVERGEAVVIIGSNGAGKTTLFKAVCGLLSATGGTVAFDGEGISGMPAHNIARSGVSYVPAERHLFPRMTVEENLALGAYPDKPDEDDFDLVFDLFPRLRERVGQRAGTMSGGEQQMLAVGRGLMSKPKMMMLDEPTTGLAPKLAAEAYQALTRLKTQGLTLLIAEQQVPLALSLADRGYVIENGRIELEGTAAELEKNPDVKRAYLGIA
jgi:branched-chain amino acid transport system ATP-binding protein